VIDFAAVPLLDSTAANAIERIASTSKRRGVQVYVTGAAPSVRKMLLAHGLSGEVAFRPDIETAVADFKRSRVDATSAA
jgi:sulfate permease, SulP family